MADPHAQQAQSPQALDDLTDTTVGRFAIRARVGAGGMGEVYRAEDTKLKRPVALKRVAPQLRTDDRYRQRLLKEAERASALSDQHVAAIHDVLEENGEIFVVMEYVEGETLRQRLGRPLGVEPFLEIAVQCSEALVAAHERGIVHRDIKPANIMLTPAGQVKILDFGVAKRLPRPDDSATTETLDPYKTGSGVSGTPGYMAPEVLLGEDSDGRADIFSLGVVFYEALTGKHPFWPPTLDRVLHEVPAPVRQLNPRLPAELERIVTKMLAKRPEQRYATAADLLVDLRRYPEPVPLPPPPLPGLFEKIAEWWRGLTRRQRGTLAATLALVVVLAVVWFLWPLPPRIPVAIVPFANGTGEPPLDEFRLTLTQFLVHELTGSPNIQVLPYDRLLVIIRGFEEGEEICSPEAIQAVADFSNSQSVVCPAMYAIPPGNILGLRTEIRDAHTGETVGTTKVERALSGSAEETLYSMLPALARGIQEYFKREGRGEEYQQRPPGSRPKTARAAYYINQGRNVLARGRYAEALRSFENAVQEDGEYALAYAWMGQIYGVLGYDEKAREFSEEAARRITPQMPTVDAYFIEATVAESKYDFSAAEAKYLELIRLLSDEAVWHASLAAVYQKQGNFQQAIARYQEALARDRNYIAAYEKLALLFSWTGEHAQAVTHAQRALSLCRALGNREGEAWALAQFAELFRLKGDVQQASESAQQALNVFQSSENESGILLATLHLGNARFIQGDFDAARSNWQRVVTTSGEIRNNHYVAIALNNLGVVYSREGDLARAVGYYEQTLSLPVVRIRQRPVAKANLAVIYVEYGPDPERGRRLAQEALDAFQEMGDTHWQANSRLALGVYYTNMGHYAEAMTQLQQARALFQRNEVKERAAQVTLAIGRSYFAQNRYEQAREALAEALAMFQALEDSLGVANARIFLGWTYLRLGNTATAGPLLEEALQSARENRHGELLPDAYNALGELARVSGDSNQARRHFQQASDLWQEPYVSQFSIEARSWLGLQEAERGNVTRGLRRCQQSAERARSLEWVHTHAVTGISLARVHLLREEYAQASEVLEEVISLDQIGLELGAQAYYARGHALEGLRRTEEAEASYRRAQEAIRKLQRTLAPEHRESFAQRPDIQAILRYRMLS